MTRRSITGVGVALVAMFALATTGPAQAAPSKVQSPKVAKFESAKVVKGTPAQVAKLNRLIRSGHFKASTAQSTTTLTVGYGCDQYAVYVSLVDPTINSYMSTSGGFSGAFDRFYTRRAATWLSCNLDMQTVNRSPVFACATTVEVAGTDSHVTGYSITSRSCRA